MFTPLSGRLLLDPVCAFKINLGTPNWDVYKSLRYNHTTRLYSVLYSSKRARFSAMSHFSFIFAWQRQKKNRTKRGISLQLASRLCRHIYLFYSIH